MQPELEVYAAGIGVYAAGLGANATRGLQSFLSVRQRWGNNF